VGVISTLKHFCLNCNETNRQWLDAVIDPVALRESDLLAFQIAIERGQPGAIMSAYNKVNGGYAGGNSVLLQDVLKGAWGYPGWVMSDWGATVSWEFALKGLDQECGVQMDAMMWAGSARSVCPAWCAGSCARCSRSGSMRGARHRRPTWPRTTQSPWRRPGKGSCC
jgi:beta-glucosidase